MKLDADTFLVFQLNILCIVDDQELTRTVKTLKDDLTDAIP